MVGHAVDVVDSGDERSTIGAAKVTFEVADGVAFGGFAVAAGEGLAARSKVVEILATVVSVKSAAAVDDEFDRPVGRWFGVVDLRWSVGGGMNQSFRLVEGVLVEVVVDGG